MHILHEIYNTEVNEWITVHILQFTSYFEALTEAYLIQTCLWNTLTRGWEVKWKCLGLFIFMNSKTYLNI